MLSLGQAATAAGVSKSTLSRSIKSGRLSASRNETGGFDIDPAELFRVYPRNPATGGATSSMTHHATPPAPPDATGETLALKAEIEGLRAQLAMMREHADELRSQRDGWQDQAVAAQRLLTDARPRRWSWFGLRSS